MKMKKQLDIKKLLLLNMPYILMGLFATNFGEGWRMAVGADASAKMLSFFSTLPVALASWWPSLHPLDLLVGLCCGAGLRLAVYLKSKNAKKYRHGMEYGSARWGTAADIAPYIDPVPDRNIPLTRTERLTMSSRPKDPKTARNKNILVIGGSGAGKTRFYAKPNIMNANTSFVVLDPKGELLRDTGHLLEEMGYEIKVLDLIDMEKSHCYNPFVYISSDDDIQRLTTNLFKNTTPKGSQTQDPFWDQTAAMLLKALVCYLHYEAPPDEQNFSMVMEMIRAGDVKEDNEEYQSVLDELFERLEERNPEHIALKYYRAYHSGSAKTLKSIQISLVSRLEKFNLDSLAGITQCDEMDLGQIGEKKTAVFAVIPDNDSSFNFIVGMLYTQLFQQLYYQADSVHGGRLPHHVRVLWDEAANTGQVPNLEKLVAVIRSREISLCLLYQQLAQCKAIYDKNAETILGNMDSVLFLGGRESSTIKEISENWLGKATISMQTEGRSRGQSESYSQNTQRLGRELMTPSELATMPGDRCILQLRGLPPFYSRKYDLKQHPNYRFTAEADKVKNAFDLDRLIDRRRRPGMNEECEMYEVSVPDEAITDEDEDILNYDDLDDPDAFV